MTNNNLLYRSLATDKWWSAACSPHYLVIFVGAWKRVYHVTTLYVKRSERLRKQCAQKHKQTNKQTTHEQASQEAKTKIIH